MIMLSLMSDIIITTIHFTNTLSYWLTVFASTHTCEKEATREGENPASNETKHGRGFEAEAERANDVSSAEAWDEEV